MLLKKKSILVLLALGIGSLFLYDKNFPFLSAILGKVSDPINSNEQNQKVSESLTSPPPYLLPITESNYLPLRDWSVSDIDLQAKAVASFDGRSGRYLFSKNIEEKLPIASLTKLMTAVIVWENLKLDTVVRVPEESVTKTKSFEGNSDLIVGEELSVLDLLRLMLIKSSNDSAYVLEYEVKNEGHDLLLEMNQLAEKLKMHDTHFLDPAGLNDQGSSSVRDLVSLVRYSLRYQGIYEILRTQSETISSLNGQTAHKISNTNKLLNFIQNIIGGKTGYTDAALGNMLLVTEIQNNAGTIITVVLGSNDRFGETKKLLEWSQNAYRWE